jgi:hypothetical protein
VQRKALRRVLNAALAVACLVPGLVAAQALDPARSRIEFELQTRWGQTITGYFPRYDGEVVVLPDGRHEVRIRLATASVEVEGSRRYARFARGERFLDAAHHPWVEFRSDPYAGELVRSGGPLYGTLSMHGVSRRASRTRLRRRRPGTRVAHELWRRKLALGVDRRREFPPARSPARSGALRCRTSQARPGFVAQAQAARLLSPRPAAPYNRPP